MFFIPSCDPFSCIMQFLKTSEMRTEALQQRRKKLLADANTAPACVKHLILENIQRIQYELKRRQKKN